MNAKVEFLFFFHKSTIILLYVNIFVVPNFPYFFKTLICLTRYIRAFQMRRVAAKVAPRLLASRWSFARAKLRVVNDMMFRLKTDLKRYQIPPPRSLYDGPPRGCSRRRR